MTHFKQGLIIAEKQNKFFKTFDFSLILVFKVLTIKQRLNSSRRFKVRHEVQRSSCSFAVEVESSVQTTSAMDWKMAVAISSGVFGLLIIIAVGILVRKMINLKNRSLYLFRFIKHGALDFCIITSTLTITNPKFKTKNSLHTFPSIPLLMYVRLCISSLLVLIV